MGRAKTAPGSPACFLSDISGWFSLSIGAWVPKNLARRSFGLLVSAARCCSTGSGRLLRGPALTSFVTLTRARARQWSARCYGVARQRDGSRQNSTGVSGVLSLRHFGLVLFIHWRVGAEESGAA